MDSSAYSTWWFKPACGAETITCLSKGQQHMRIKLHNKACAMCRKMNIIVEKHPDTTINPRQKPTSIKHPVDTTDRRD